MEYSPEKFLNAILFFAHNVSKLGITKLNKLLYYSDFEHYRLYGRPILGDQYIRMERGPVPQASYAVFNANFEDSEDSSLKEAIEVRGENFFSRQFNNAYERKSIIPKREADLSYFSKSEIETME